MSEQHEQIMFLTRNMIKDMLNECTNISSSFIKEEIHKKQDTFITGTDHNSLYLPTLRWFPHQKSLIAKEFPLNKLENIGLQINQAEEEKIKSIMSKDRLNDFENQKVAPPPLSKSQLKKKQREERSKTAGKGWFDLGKPVMTDELKQELNILKMRQYTNPKKFFKKTPIDIDDYFGIGKVVSHASEYYTSPNTKAKGKSDELNFVDELLKDSNYKKYAKRKYREIIEKKEKSSKRKKVFKK